MYTVGRKRAAYPGIWRRVIKNNCIERKKGNSKIRKKGDTSDKYLFLIRK